MRACSALGVRGLEVGRPGRRPAAYLKNQIGIMQHDPAFELAASGGG